MRTLVSLVLAGSLALVAAAQADDFDTAKLNNWHHWRGPHGNGVSLNTNPPLKWDESTNVKWKVEVPGSGSSTPVVWGDKLFLTSAIDTGKKGSEDTEESEESKSRKPDTVFQFVVFCIDRNTGETIWKQIATEAVPHEGHHGDHGYASGSATTDGTSLFVTFGSRGIYCYDLDGNLNWKRDLGQMQIASAFGEAASPTLHRNALIVNWDHEGDSFICSLNAKSGADNWRVERDEGTTWNTPLIVEHDGVTQIIVNGTNRTRSYDFSDGKLIWECGGQAGFPIASPVAENGIVYCMTGYRGAALTAIPLDSKGDITDTDKIAWTRDQATPYVPSPVVHDGLLYFTRSNSGVLTCVKADTGEVVYEKKRLKGVSNMYSSITYAAERLYITSRKGTTVVLKFGPELEYLATNKLDERIDTSPVFIGNMMYLRGATHLYCIAEQ